MTASPTNQAAKTHGSGGIAATSMRPTARTLNATSKASAPRNRSADVHGAILPRMRVSRWFRPGRSRQRASFWRSSGCWSSWSTTTHAPTSVRRASDTTHSTTSIMSEVYGCSWPSRRPLSTSQPAPPAVSGPHPCRSAARRSSASPGVPELDDPLGSVGGLGDVGVKASQGG
jgi:hypothetical protein